MNVFAGQDGDADIEDRLGDTGVDEREGQIESNTETYTLPYGTSQMGISCVMQGAQTGAL